MGGPVTAAPDFARLGRSVRAPERFAEIYDPLAQNRGGYIFKLVPFMLPGPEDWPPCSFAFAQAYQHGWLPELLSALIAQGALQPPGAESAFRFEGQAILDPAAGMPLVAVSALGLAHASSRLCLIKVHHDGKDSWGTGFLVGPQVVLTAYHVIKPLLQAPEYDNPIPGSASSLILQFDYLAAGKGTYECVAGDWLLAHSAQHEKEGNDNLPFDLTDGLQDFEHRLDFAALRLARPIGRERGYYNIGESRLPRPDEAVVVIQHPSKDPMRCAIGVAGKLWPESIETRLPHTANTMPGSSGGIVLDEAYRPLGLHQGCVKQNGSAVANVAVPTQRIASLNLPLTITEGIDPVWRIDATGLPVFGRGQLQKLVHTAIVGALRVLIVTGGTRSGKSFSTQILRQRVLHSGDVVLHASARTLPLDVSQLAGAWLHQIGGTAEQCTALPKYAEADSALPAWLRDQLVPAFMQSLEQILGGRRLWVVLDDLDSATFPPGGVALFVEYILQRTSQHPQLRVMLIGGADPGNIPYDVLGYDRIDPVTCEEVRATATLELVATRGYAPPASMSLFANAVMTANPDSDTGRMAEMYRKLMRVELEVTP